MGTHDLTAIAYQVVSDLLGVVTSSFDVDADAQHRAAGLVLAGLVEAQRLASGSQARQLASEWQEVVATLTEDTTNWAESVTDMKLRPEVTCHPYFAGRLSLLKTFKIWADKDAARFEGSTYPVEVELLRAQLAATQAHLGVLLALLCRQQFSSNDLQVLCDRWWGAHQLAAALEQKLVKV